MNITLRSSLLDANGGVIGTFEREDLEALVAGDLWVACRGAFSGVLRPRHGNGGFLLLGAAISGNAH